MGVFWKKFTNASVVATFVAGSALVILGIYYPRPLIQIFAHGTAFEPAHPYLYIGALYNLFVCVFVGVVTTLTRDKQKQIVEVIKANVHHKKIMAGITLNLCCNFSCYIF